MVVSIQVRQLSMFEIAFHNSITHWRRTGQSMTTSLLGPTYSRFQNGKKWLETNSLVWECFVVCSSKKNLGRPHPWDSDKAPVSNDSAGYEDHQKDNRFHHLTDPIRSGPGDESQENTRPEKTEFLSGLVASWPRVQCRTNKKWR